MQGGGKMAVQAKEQKLKLRLKYDKGSQTFSQCDAQADDNSLYEVAMAIYSLRKDEDIEITKVVETELVEQ